MAEETVWFPKNELIYFFLTMRNAKHWAEAHREIVQSPYLQAFRTQLYKVLRNLV